VSEHSETFMTVRGCKVRLMRGGAGAPLVFLHGGGGAGPWQPFMAALAESFDVIVPEHPGFGDSETPDWLDNIHDMAYFYLEVLRALDLAKVHLVGHSIGGWIAAELAVRSTARLASLTLVAAAGLRVNGVAAVDPFLLPDDERIRAMVHDPGLADRLVERALAPENLDANFKNRAAVARLSWQPRGHDPHLPKWLHLIEAPTLLVWGEHDRMFPEAVGREYARLIPDSELVVLPACGHMPNLEKTGDFVGHIRRFTGGIAS